MLEVPDWGVWARRYHGSVRSTLRGARTRWGREGERGWAMAGARADAAVPGSWAAPGGALSRESGLGELLQEFSRTQYRAKDGGGTGGSKVGPGA